MVEARHGSALCVAMLVGLAAGTGVGLAEAKPIVLSPLQERGKVLAHPVLPLLFRGRWSVDARDCRTAPIEDTQVWVTRNSVNFYETNGHAVRVVIENSRRLVVTLKSENEGTTFQAKKGLSLSSDLSALTIRDEDDTGKTTFHRCRPERGSSSDRR